MSRPEQESVSPEQRERLMDLSIASFEVIKLGWQATKTLGWQPTVDSLRNAIAILETPEAMQFLDEFLLEIVKVLSSQSPSKLGTFERKCVEDALVLSSHIATKLLPDMPRFLPVVVKIFDPTCTYYAGSKSGTWASQYQGFPQARITLVKRFASLNGFDAVLAALRHADAVWAGAEALNVLVKALCETIAVVQDSLREELVATVARSLLTLSDEQLKRENTEVLHSLLRALGHAYSWVSPEQAAEQHPRGPGHGALAFQAFWLEYTLKSVNSGFLVVKLFGLDQVQELIREAYATRPFATAYRVIGAGNDVVNGLYTLSQVDNGQAVTYQKQPGGPDEPLLTLFRCTMRTKSKWWFISQADKDKPGTDKDIDYYQHKSNVDEEREPPLRGWNCLTGGTAATVSKDPPPTLERIGEVVPEGVDTSEYLVHRLARWCLEHDLLAHFFSPSSLRVEVISRGLKLVLFLSEADALTAEHVQLMWRAAAQSQDVDIVEEVFTVLVQVSWHLRADLFKVLIELALQAVTKPGDNAAGAFAKASVFAEKFAMEANRLGELGDESASLLLSLVWAIYRSPGFDGLKNSFAIQELLSRCFDLKAGMAMAVHRVRECAEALHAIAAKHSSAAVPAGPAMQRVSSSSVSAGAPTLPEEELSAARVIHTLQFLICKHVSHVAIETLNAEGVPEVLIAEVKRFYSVNGGRMVDDASSSSSSSGANKEALWYRAQLAERLQVIRLFYGISPTVKVPQTMLEELWALLKGSSQGLEEFFGFLTKGATGPSGPVSAVLHASEAFCDWYACLHIFKTFLCSPEVDWSQSSGSWGYECFRNFYIGLRKAPEGPTVRADVDVSVLPPMLGLDTLWEIVLRLPLEATAHAATDLLLQAYDTIAAETDADAPSLLLQRIFALVETAQQEVEAGMAGPAVGRLLTRVDRLVGVLEGAISRSKGDAGPPHAVCGSMSRITVRAHHRRATSYINQDTNAEVIRGEKGTDGSIFVDVHPLHTVRDLKIKVADRLGYTTSYGLNIVGVGMNSVITQQLNTRKVLVEKGGESWRDSSRLRQLGLVDGSDVHMTFIVTSAYALKPTYDDSGVVTHGEGDAGAPHVGAALAASWERFDSLLALCDALHREFPKGTGSAADAAAAAMKIFDLLVLVPTQPEVLRTVEQLGSGQAGAGMHWGALLDEAHTSLARVTYALQIVDNLLQPAPEFRTPDVDARAARFRTGFIESHGFSAVLQVLIRTPAPPPAAAGASSDMNRYALASALSIVHFLLFGGGGSGNDGDVGLEDGLAAVDLGRDGSVAGSPRTSSSAAAAASGYTLPLTLQRELEASAVGVAEKLLAVASSAAADESAGASGVVHNALKTITYLIRAPDVASQLISNNPQSRSLLTTVLRSVSKKVREMSADFAIEVGRTQPVVFSWLLAEMETLDRTDNVCSDIFRALGTLVETLRDVPRAIDMGHLGAVLCQRLMAYPRGGAKHGHVAASTASGSDDQQVLTGYLLLLEKVIRIEPSAIPAGAFNGNLVQTFLNEFLFAMPTDEEQDITPICDQMGTRSAAYQVLAAYLSLSPEPFEIALAAVGQLADAASEQIRSSWGIQVSHDVKRPDVTFCGLKNQGCTCYLNSLLQQLFMNVQFRNAILQTTLRETHRTTVWHRQPHELVGLTLLFEWSGGLWKRGKVVHYDGSTREHTVQYEDDTHGEAAATYVLHEGRYQKETGHVRVVPPDTFVGEDGEATSMDPLTERDESSIRVLEQLQRTFCFMQFSKRRYFDPRPFVEACKGLDMSFNVYHQNDAAELYDQLLDRIEIAASGKYTKQNVWGDVILQQIQGKMTYKKRPEGCEAFKHDERACGHGDSHRSETFLKFILDMKGGKDKVEDSLHDLVADELFDGENALKCEVCLEKKPVLRLTRIGQLPNTLILHLKRFDIDYSTFETVKLNNRMAFGLRLNMLKYTAAGIEAEERRARRAAAQAEQDAEGGPLEYDEDEGAAELDPDDFDYELQGVLVHAGIAQGGHYYSFISDIHGQTPAGTGTGTGAGAGAVAGAEAVAAAAAVAPRDNKWFRFDDEDVSHFKPEHIPVQCFGGPPSANGQHGHGSDEDRTSNALMLFFKKVRPSPPQVKDKDTDGPGAAAGGAGEAVAATAAAVAVKKSVTVTDPGALLVNGYQAFGREVRESNLLHVLTCYVLDADLHAFVRGLIASVSLAHRRSYPAAQRRLVAGAAAETHSADPFSAADAASHVSELRWSPAASVGPAGADGADLPLRTVMFGCRFLFDVVLHCRERAGMRAWVTVLREAFETFPHTALWLLGAVLDDSGRGSSTTCSTWLNSYLSHSSDALARGTFVQVLAQAVAAVAPPLTAAAWTDFDPLSQVVKGISSHDLRELAGIDEGDASPGRLPSFIAAAVASQADVLQVTAPAAEDWNMRVTASQALVALLVRDLNERVLMAPNSIRTSDELFVLVRDLAAVPSVCVCMLSAGFASALAYFAIPDQTLPEVKARFATHSLGTHSRGMHARNEYYPLLQSVYEALAALLGVPQLRKVALLQDRTYWENCELVPEAKEAFATIFAEVAPQGGMDAHCMSDYQERVNGPGFKITPLQVRQILDRYHTNADNRLSLEGFLHYQADQAWTQQKNVWKDLHAFGFQNDLKRSPNFVRDPSRPPAPPTAPSAPPDVAAAAAVAAPSIAPAGTVALPQLGRYLPRQCKWALCTYALFEVGLEPSESSAKAIFRRAMTHDHLLSHHLARQALVRLYRASSDVTWNQTNGIIEFLRVFVGVEDDLVAVRVRLLLLDQQFGFASVVEQERVNPFHCRANEYERGALLSRYVGFAQEMCAVPAFLDGVHALAAEDATVRQLKRYLKMSQPGQPLGEADLYQVRNSSVEVTNALKTEVNGVYTFAALKTGAGYYRRQGEFGGQEATFTLYKCSVNNGGNQWFISTTPDGSEPGTTKDTDFYYGQSKQDFYGSVLPPRQFSPMDSKTERVGPVVACTVPTDEQTDMAMQVVPEASAQRLAQLQQQMHTRSYTVECGGPAGPPPAPWVCLGGQEPYGSMPMAYLEADRDVFIGSILAGPAGDGEESSPEASPSSSARPSPSRDHHLTSYIGLENVGGVALDGMALGGYSLGGLEDDTEVDGDNPSIDQSGADLDSSDDDGSMVVADGAGNFVYGSPPGSPPRPARPVLDTVVVTTDEYGYTGTTYGYNVNPHAPDRS